MKQTPSHNAAYWKEKLQLQPHIEGGAYSRTYTSPIPVSTISGDRPLSSAIYFLLEHGEFSAFHRIRSDEMWHFYAGSTLHLYEINKEGTLITHLLGNEPENGEQFQVLIPTGSWFASTVKSPGEFALVGCTVTPAFDFSDFELADRHELINQYPQYEELITMLTW